MLRRIFPLIPFIIVTILASACGILREPAEASAPIEAVPLEVEDTSAPDEASSETAADVGGQSASDVEDSSAEAAGDRRLFTISQAQSQVRFELDEDLRGQRQTVVGTTDQIAGEIVLDLNELSTAQLGEIRINARTLTTDSNFRNRAIANDILDTRAYEFITFSPTGITGLSGSAGIGEEFDFSVDGELTIRDVTQPVTFDVVAAAVSEAEISGTASAVVSRDDFDLQIPSVRNVANVEEEVELYIDFVAVTS